MSTYFTAYVPVPYADYKNKQPTDLAKLALEVGILHDGGGMFFEDGNYEHVYLTRKREIVDRFIAKAVALGYWVRGPVKYDEPDDYGTPPIHTDELGQT